MLDICNDLLDKNGPRKPVDKKASINSTVSWYTYEIDKASIDCDIADRDYKNEYPVYPCQL